MQFEDLGLDKRLLTAISHWGLTSPTQVQAAAIPLACAGRDLLTSSKTGSGKTFAFLLPAIQRVLRTKALGRKSVRVAVLTPTRELAKQVHSELKKLLAGSSFKSVLIVGGENFNDQAKVFRKDPSFVVATPGRLADHIEHRHLDMSALELLILDEADRMLDLGFAKELKAIHQVASHRRRQTLMFSATLDHNQVNEIAADMLTDPKRIAIGYANEANQDIEQRFYLTDHLEHKQTLLDRVLNDESFNQLIVFTATRADTERLASKLLKQKIKAIALNGEMNQSVRNRIMNEFERGIHQVLITTDLASRGLDILNVSHVVNFDMPKHAEEYVHRIGRTGRAGNKGIAISFVGPKDWQSLKKIEAFLNTRVQFIELAGLSAKFKGIREKSKPVKAQQKARAKPKTISSAKKNRSMKRDKSYYQSIAVGDDVFKIKKKKNIDSSDAKNESSQD